MVVHFSRYCVNAREYILRLSFYFLSHLFIYYNITSFALYDTTRYNVQYMLREKIMRNLAGRAPENHANEFESGFNI